MSENINLQEINNYNNEELAFDINKKDRILTYLDNVLESIIQEEELINHYIKKCKNKLEEVQSKVERLEKQLDPNGIFFTPQYGKQTNYNKYINQEIVDLSNELDSYNLRKKAISERKNNVMEVIDFINEITGEKKIISNKTCDNRENLNYNFTDEIHIKMFAIQENERKRIARDIHDSTVQNLVSLVHKAELCTKLVDQDSIKTKLELQIMIGTIRNTIDELRMTIYDLRPMAIDDVGLVSAIERYVNNFKIRNSIEIKFEINGTEHEFEQTVRMTIFRVIQEACNNIIKHANANNINILFYYKEYELEIIIEDNGVGFELENIQKSKESLSGLGISIMKERIYLLSGDIRFYKGEIDGTKIIIDIPYSNNQ